MFLKTILSLAFATSALIAGTVLGAAAGSSAPSEDSGTMPLVLGRTATVEQDGVLLRITVDRNPLTTDGPVRVTTLVRNVGDDDLIWYHDGCAISVLVKGMMLGQGWRSSEPPEEQDPQSFLWRAHEFWIGAFDEIYLDFRPPRFLDDARVSCPDIGIRDRIKPGQSLRGQQVWADGTADGQLGPPPDGPVRLTGTFGSYTRPSLPGGPDRELEVTLDAWLAGGREASMLHPMELLVAALSDEGFREWLDSTEPTGVRDIIRYDPSLDMWEIGYFDYETDRFRLGLVDPRTGEVMTIIERPWNESREPYP